MLTRSSEVSQVSSKAAKCWKTAEQEFAQLAESLGLDPATSGIDNRDSGSSDDCRPVVDGSLKDNSGVKSGGDSKGDGKGDDKGDDEKGDDEKGDGDSDSDGDSEGNDKGDDKGDDEGDDEGDSDSDSDSDDDGEDDDEDIENNRDHPRWKELKKAAEVVVSRTTHGLSTAFEFHKVDLQWSPAQLEDLIRQHSTLYDSGKELWKVALRLNRQATHQVKILRTCAASFLFYNWAPGISQDKRYDDARMAGLIIRIANKVCHRIGRIGLITFVAMAGMSPTL